MRPLAYLIPSLFFLLAFAAMEGSRDLLIAELQAKASSLTVEMEKVSNRISGIVQEVNLGNAEYEEVRDDIDRSNLDMEALRTRLDEVWARMDETRVRAARDDGVRRYLRILGVCSGCVGLIAIGRDRLLLPHCILGITILLGLAGVGT